MEYLSELAYMTSQVAGVSVQSFRIEPTNTTDALSGRKVSFALPSSALLNMRTLALHFSADAAQTASVGGRLPPKITSLIDRIEISAGGQMIQQGFNQQNTFHHLRDALCETNNTDHVLGHPYLVREVSYVDGYGSAGSATLATNGLGESYATSGGQTQFCVNNFVSFPSTCEPPIQNMSLLPDCIFSVYFAGNEVLGCSNGYALSNTGVNDITDVAPTATAAFKVYNLHLTIEAIGLASSVYDNIIASEIAANGYVSVPFKNYFSLSDTHTGSTKWSVSTQSLDRVWVTTRAQYYDTSQAISVIKGYKLKGAGVSSSTSGFSSAFDIGKLQYDVGGTPYANGELYTTAYFNFAENRASPGTAPTYQVQLNGSYIPAYKASTEEMWQVSKNSVPKYHGGKPMFISLDQYRNNYFGFCLRLNLPNDDVRVISGLDTRSVNLQGYVNTTGLPTTTNMMVFAECTSTLRIGQGRQMNVVV